MISGPSLSPSSSSTAASSYFSQFLWMPLPPICPCQRTAKLSSTTRKKGVFRACVVPIDGRNQSLGFEFANSVSRGLKSNVVSRISDEFDEASDSLSEDSVQLGYANVSDEANHSLSANSLQLSYSNVELDEASDSLPEDSMQLGYANVSDEANDSANSTQLSYSNDFNGFREDPIVGKLRTQLGVIHPIPALPTNSNIAGMFVFFFVFGVVFDKLWTSRKRKRSDEGGKLGIWPQVPTSFSLFLEKDLQRKESVEWVNMVLGKLWKVYRGGLENWVIGLLQPVIDDLKKPDYVERVEITQFSLGDEPFVVRNVERRTSRSINDLQYQIGLRYTGGARMLLMLTLKFGIIPIKVPVGVRDFDIDGELWVKLRLIPTEPWVGAASWAFVSLPKIKFELSPFRLFNLMAIPVLSMFLKKLLTEDLPRLFVRPEKIVLDFQKGKAVGPVQNSFTSQEGNKDFAGELSVTLVDARKLSYIFYGKTDPYVELKLGDLVIHSKKNSQTTVIGPPGQPIWNQDFSMLVTNPRKQKLSIRVRDSLGFIGVTVGAGEVDLGSLKDTVPTDRIVSLQGGWGLLRKGSAGEILLRLTYKAYVEDEDDEMIEADIGTSDDEFSELETTATTYDPSSRLTNQESFMDVLAALIVSEEFQGIVASETTSSKSSIDASNTGSRRSPGTVTEPNLADSDSGSGSLGGSALFWLGVITTMFILTAINMGGSNIFNP